MFKVVEDGNQVILETERGRFILSDTLDEDYKGFYIDYQEPGAPVRNLAVVEHIIDEDCLRLCAWEHTDSEFDEMTHIIQFDRPQSDGLTRLTELIQQVKQTHAGCELVVIKADSTEYGPNVYLLGYFDCDYNLYQLHQLTIDAMIDDIKYCVEHHGIEWRQE